MKEDAKSFYQELVDKFPKSQLSKKVKSKLK
jgi:TolA-binding protein